MRSYSSREVIRMLMEDGWVQVAVTGDHHHFKHPTKPGKNGNTVYIYFYTVRTTHKHTFRRPNLPEIMRLMGHNRL